MLTCGRVVVQSKRTGYTPERRREAEALVLDTDRPITHVAEEIGVGAQLLGRWVQQLRERRDPAPDPGAPLTAEERDELMDAEKVNFEIEIVVTRRQLHSTLDRTSPVTVENAIERDQAETEEHFDQAHAV